MRKMKNAGLLLAVAVITFFTSCQKEVSFDETPPDPGGNGGGGNGGGGGNANALAGTYKFVGMYASTKATTVFNDAGMELKAVATSNYSSQNNVGTMVFTASQSTSTGIGYDIDGIVNLAMYIDGMLLQDQNSPFVYNLPPTNGASAYTVITSDSITFATSPMGTNVPGVSGVSAPPGPYGMKLSWSGDTLKMRMRTTFSQPYNQPGMPTGRLDATVDGTIKLKKQ